MTAKIKAALHRGNDDSAKALGRSKHIVSDYERGALIAGLITAVSFGSLFIHAAVVL